MSSKYKTIQDKKHKRRNIENVPFYKIQYGFDELPLDPIKPFILEKIRESLILILYPIRKF